MTVTKEESSDPIWWCNHHKQSVKYLVIRIHQLLNSKDESREQIESMLAATLPAFAEAVGVELDEVKIS